MKRLLCTCLLLVTSLSCSQVASAPKGITYDAEYYILKAQHGEK